MSAGRNVKRFALRVKKMESIMYRKSQSFPCMGSFPCGASQGGRILPSQSGVELNKWFKMKRLISSGSLKKRNGKRWGGGKEGFVFLSLCVGATRTARRSGACRPSAQATPPGYSARVPPALRGSAHMGFGAGPARRTGFRRR